MVCHLQSTLPFRAHLTVESRTEWVQVWGTDLRLGQNTVLSYGPWADKHRDRLYSFFFPPDFQDQRPTKAPSKGQMWGPLSNAIAGSNTGTSQSLLCS